MRAKLDVQHLARTHTRAAVRALVDIIKDEKAPHAARASASQTLLDRGWGKPSQEVNLTGSLEQHIVSLVQGLDEDRPPIPSDTSLPEGETQH